MALSADQFAEIVSDIYEGMSLGKSLEKRGLSRNLFYKLLNENLECEISYARARQAQADLFVEQILPIADDETIDPNRARNMISARQWAASKMRPQVYGERIDLNVTTTASITLLLACYPCVTQ